MIPILLGMISDFFGNKLIFYKGERGEPGHKGEQGPQGIPGPAVMELLRYFCSHEMPMHSMCCRLTHKLSKITLNLSNLFEAKSGH